MEYLQGLFPVCERKIGTMIDLTLHCPELVAQAKAGQFVHIRVPGFFLRRPISICALDRQKGDLRLLFEIRGEGTAALSKIQLGDLLDVMGPLGNGFTLLEKNKRAVAVGGGIGTPPMLQLAKEYGQNLSAILGFRDQSKIILTEEFAALGARVMLATDDGSAGHHGFVSDLLEQRLAEEEAVQIVYACGPKPMLQAVAACCAAHQVRCQVSLEERMACGVGACLGCACKTVSSDGSLGYEHVCKNGPVFEAERVCFDESRK